MANALRMALIEAILSLRQRGWSRRRIARELGIDRETVARYLRTAMEPSKPANAPLGSVAAAVDSKPAIAPIGSDQDLRSHFVRSNNARGKDQGEGCPVREDGAGQVRGQRLKGGAHFTFDANGEADLKGGSALPDQAIPLVKRPN
jgi:transcriptional regulator with XRE-family HTH domain